MKRLWHGIGLLPPLLIWAAVAAVWRDLPNYEAHMPGWTLPVLIAALPFGVGFCLHAFAGRHWGQLAAIAMGVAACVLMLSVTSLTGYCVDCDKVPPRVGPLQGWVLRASGWEDCHPDAFMSWNDNNQGESE